MQKYNFETPVINNVTNKPFVKQINVDVTVKDAVIEALVNPLPQTPITESEKLLRGELAEFISNNPRPQLTEEDVALIRKCSLEYSGVSFAHAVIKALEKPIAKAATTIQ